ncbi:TIR domain-containing protein [Aquincola sp. S2]|uniref:TIR domain-containing protein n=1 Tax=Pseudaquabacterium terrae TaxID=2732868 RepID=A0ABX2ER66_9BURK|nr:TIR domain-containing protein [Aquabacterium terrae]NRF71207.1 TIR domain-containing protein [Aquabacterium terrae]
MSSVEEHSVRSGVFVSYSRKDGEAFAHDLRTRLQERGIVVWHDRIGMEGGRDWWEQIKQALNRVEFIVLVMTPAALQSDVVRKEWRYARQQGVCVYPVIAQPGLDIAGLPRWMSSVHWYDLAHQEARFFNDLNTRCERRRVPFMTEPLPADYVPRSVPFERLKRLLLAPGNQEPVAITAGLRGAGGYGKTTLARAICCDEDVQNAFDDGVLWVTLGEAPDTPALLGKLNDLIRTLSDERPTFEGLDAAATRLRELLADRDILLVIDDVWRAADLRPFLKGGARCARLITTRRAGTLPNDATKVPVDEMSGTEAAELLRKGLPVGHDEAIYALAARLGKWPLLLKLANSLLRKRIHHGQSFVKALGAIAEDLTKRGVTAFDPQIAEERDDAAAKTLELSYAGLGSSDRQRLLELAVFEEDMDIPLHVLERFWSHTGRLDLTQTDETCLRLFDDSLLVQVDLDERFVRLHDAIRAWLIARPGRRSLAQRHGQLLASYEAPGRPWHQVDDDGYVHQHLARHLAAAGRHADLRSLLLDPDWMRVRLTARGARDNARSDVFGLLSAFDEAAPEPDLTLIRHALQMSTHVLVASPDQLPLQLYGRLGRSAAQALQSLCDRALSRASHRALFPLRPGLTPPGPLALTLTGHTESIGGVVLLDEGRQALSWSPDRTLKLWDLRRGELLHSLAGHDRGVDGATILAEGWQALSWSKDGTLKLWDLERGELLRNLTGHENEVLGGTLMAKGQQALSWSHDRTLRLWDLQRGKLLRTLAGHQKSVNGAALLAEGRQALSWSHDGTLKLWDVQCGKLLHTLAGHEDWVWGATLLAEGRQALSWSRDGTLKLWDLERGVLLHNLVGHESWVRGVNLTADGRRALSWSYDNLLKAWDLRRGELLRDLVGHASMVNGAALLDDGRQALSWSADYTIKLWDLQRGALLYTFAGHEDAVIGATLGAGGRQALSWSNDLTIKLWDLERGELLHNFYGHEQWITGAKLLAEGRQALSWSHDGTLKLWDLERGEPPHDLTRHESSVIGATLLASGRKALSWSDDRTLKLWDLERGELLHNFAGHEQSVMGATLLAADRQALSWSDDGTLKLWDLERGELLHNLPGHEYGVGATLLAGGRQALSWSPDGSFKLWDLDRGELLHDLPNESPVFGALPLGESRQALSWLGDGTLELWDLERGERLRSFGGHRAPLVGATLLAEDQQVLSWSEDHTLKLWDLQSGEQLHDFVGRGSVTGATLLADGRQALSWSSRGALDLWDLQRGELLRNLAGHEDWVIGAMLLAEGRQAMSWSVDRTLKLWDLERGLLLRTLSGHEGAVIGATLLGPQVLSRSNDRTCRLWDIDKGNCIDVYLADATSTAVVADVNRQRLLMFDLTGRVHLLRLLSD